MVKEGYKETEIGVIPADWAVATFGDKVKIYRGGSPRPITNYLTTSDAGVNWIKIGDVKSGEKYINKTEEKIIPEGVSKSREVFSGDFILSNSMSFGRPYILNIDGCIHDGWLTIQSYDEFFDKEYLYYLLSSDMVFAQYISMAAGSSVKNLNKDKVSSLIVAIPAKSEQQKIAEALSDMDNLISSLEKLIEKKKTIKQGAMQELLTGGKQLYSNANELEEIPIKDLFSYINGKSLEEFFNYNSGYKVISIGNYSSEGTFIDTNTYIDHSYKAQFHNLIASNNDLVMILNDKTSIGTILGRVLLIDKDDSYIINQRSVILRLKNDKFCAKYFYYLLNSKYVRKNIMKKSKPGTQIYLNLPDVLELSVKYTSDIKEQQIIANTLSDIDAEIAALEQKLTKCQKLKQGMMQQLLTGKIRLI